MLSGIARTRLFPAMGRRNRIVRPNERRTSLLAAVDCKAVGERAIPLPAVVAPTTVQDTRLVRLYRECRLARGPRSCTHGGTCRRRSSALVRTGRFSDVAVQPHVRHGPGSTLTGVEKGERKGEQSPKRHVPTSCSGTRKGPSTEEVATEVCVMSRKPLCLRHVGPATDVLLQAASRAVRGPRNGRQRQYRGVSDPPCRSPPPLGPRPRGSLTPWGCPCEFDLRWAAMSPSKMLRAPGRNREENAWRFPHRERLEGTSRTPLVTPPGEATCATDRAGRLHETGDRRASRSQAPGGVAAMRPHPCPDCVLECRPQAETLERAGVPIRTGVAVTARSGGWSALVLRAVTERSADVGEPPICPPPCRAWLVRGDRAVSATTSGLTTGAVSCGYVQVECQVAAHE